MGFDLALYFLLLIFIRAWLPGISVSVPLPTFVWTFSFLCLCVAVMLSLDSAPSHLPLGWGPVPQRSPVELVLRAHRRWMDLYLSGALILVTLCSPVLWTASPLPRSAAALRLAGWTFLRIPVSCFLVLFSSTADSWFLPFSSYIVTELHTSIMFAIPFTKSIITFLRFKNSVVG